MAELTLPPPRHLLVRLPNPLGDAVLATPALRALRRALPATRITWTGRRAALAAVADLPHRDDVMPIAFPRGWREPLRTGRMWRRLGPDAVLLLTHGLGGAIAAWLSRATQRVGSGREGRRPLLHHVVALPEKDGKLAPRPMTAMYLDLVRPYGAEDDGAGCEVACTPLHRRRASRWLEPIPADARLVVVSPGAAWSPTKIYPPRRLGAALAAVLEARPDARGLVVCAPGEEGLARTTAEAAGRGVLHTADDPPDVGTLVALLERASLFLGPDAGPRHLAEALGVPSVAVLGPTDPAWTQDRPGVVVRNASLPCLGCHLTQCPIGQPCMEDLDPAVVADAALVRIPPEAG